MSSACAIGEDTGEMAKPAPLPLVLVVPVDGQLDRHQVTRLLGVFPSYAGASVTVTIEKTKATRSAAQLRWLWGRALPLIADHCGYDAHELERLHYDLLAVRFGTHAEVPLLAAAPPRIVPRMSTRDLSVGEMSLYMDWLVRYAADSLGVVVPLPDEVPV
jgi:hypothetical protein